MRRARWLSLALSPHSPWLLSGVIALQLGVSLWRLMGDPGAWLAAALAVFTLAVIWLGHGWRNPLLEQACMQTFNGFWQRIALVGVLLFVAPRAWRRNCA